MIELSDPRLRGLEVAKGRARLFMFDRQKILPFAWKTGPKVAANPSLFTRAVARGSQ